MNNCPSCQHPRLVHDSWGCKLQCSCGVSIIFLTLLLFSRPEMAVEELIEQGNLFVREIDLREESRVEEMNRRSILEVAPLAEQLQ